MTENKTSFYALLLMALAGYLLPWIVAQNTAMTLNAYDLAEWTSLHPSQKQMLVPFVPLLIRLQLPFITIMFTLLAGARSSRWMPLSVVALLAVAQLPPLEFLHNLSDSNYQQQFALSALTIILALASLRYIPPRLRPLALLGLATLGSVTSLIGQSQAQSLYHQTWQEGTVGAGLWITVLAYGFIGAIVLVGLRRSDQDMPRFT